MSHVARGMGKIHSENYVGRMMQIVKLGDSGRGVRQGDVVEFIGDFPAPYGAKVAVIITADCDLVKEKHYGHLLLCPIVSANIYFDNVWLPTYVDKKKKEWKELARKKYLNLIKVDNLSEISEETISLVLATKENLNSSISELGFARNGSVEEIERFISAIDELSGSSCGLLDGVIKAEELRAGRDKDKVINEIISNFRQGLNSDSVDTVVLPDNIHPNSYAHVVLLRSPFSISVDKLGRKGDPDICAFRIGAYEPQLKFLLAQKFGYLFSRIGMPGAIEDERKVCVEIMEISV